MDVMQEGVVVAERAVMRAHCLTRLYAAMARNRLDAGDMPTAVQTLALGLAMSERHGNCTTCDALLLPVAVSVWIGQGNVEEAESFCTQLEEAAEQYRSRIWVATARQARGELDLALGEMEEALSRFLPRRMKVLKMLDMSMKRHVVWRLQQMCANGAAPSGDGELERQARREAEHIFERLSASFERW